MARNPNTDPRIPLSDMFPATFEAGVGVCPTIPDQEIRARALEAAVKLYDNVEPHEMPRNDKTVRQHFWSTILEFEDYIRNGK